MNTQSISRFAAIAACISILAACSGGSGGNTGELRIGLTDGPVESADKVVVAFTGIQLKAADAEAPMDPVYLDESSCDSWDAATGTCSIDLLQLQGENRRVVYDAELPAGTYEWIRLLVDADRNEMDSYVEIGGMGCPMFIPSGAQSGLKIIKDITLAANGVADYTLDFDVRKSITAPPGLSGTDDTMEACQQNYILKPVLRVVSTTEVGTIEGEVSKDTLSLNECPTDATSGLFTNLAAYIFENTDGNAVPDDIDEVEEDVDGEDGTLVGRNPVTTASVRYDSDNDRYVYAAGYLLQNEDYLVALTCESDKDMPDTNELDLAFTSEDEPTFGFIGGEASVTLDSDSVTVPTF